MQRVVAVVGAVALIVGAIVIRQLITGDDGGGSSGGDGGGGDPFVVACVTELERACEEMARTGDGVDVVVEDAGETMARLVAGDSGYDGWVTFSPWPDVVAIDEPADRLGTPIGPVASTDLLLAVPDTAEPCPGIDPVTWRCLGENAADVGLPPRTTGLGLLLVGNGASGYFGTTEFATNDMDSDAAFDDWLDNITADPTGDDPLDELLLAFPPTLVFDAVGTTRVDVDTEVPGSRAEDRLEVVEPSPAAMAAVVAAPIGERGADRLGDVIEDGGLASVLGELGWNEGGPEDTGLPTGGVMYELLDR